MIEMLKKMGLALAVISALSVNVSAGKDHADHSDAQEEQKEDQAEDDQAAAE